jgi:hypothetical protein
MFSTLVLKLRSKVISLLLLVVRDPWSAAAGLAFKGVFESLLIKYPRAQAWREIHWKCRMRSMYINGNFTRGSAIEEIEVANPAIEEMLDPCRVEWR